MEQAQACLERLYTALRDVTDSAETLDSELAKPYRDAFCAAMDDDFNTPEAFAVFRLKQSIRPKTTVMPAS